jgi:hypothetical protein
MKLPLTCFICAILIIVTVTDSQAKACDSKGKKAKTIEVTVELQGDDGDSKVVAICSRSEAVSSSKTAALKSSLRAGVAVGKAVGRKAMALASSVACATRHAAEALLETATAMV